MPQVEIVIHRMLNLQLESIELHRGKFNRMEKSLSFPPWPSMIPNSPSCLPSLAPLRRAPNDVRMGASRVSE